MKLKNVRSDCSAVTKKITITARVIAAIAISSHLPERVSASLRSSTRTSRESGTPGVAERSMVSTVRLSWMPSGWSGALVMALMGILRVGCRR